MPTLAVLTSTNVDNAIPEYWLEKLYYDHVRKSFWDEFEGPEGGGMPILRKDEFDKLKRNGDVVHFTTMTRLRNAGVTGNSTLATNEGKVQLGQFDLTVDWLRNAMAYDEQADQEAFFDTAMVINEQLSDWFARRKDTDMFTQLIDTDSPTTLYANSKTNSNELDSNSKFGTTELDIGRLALKRKGARPISMIRDEKTRKMVPIYGCVITEVDSYNLRADTQWINSHAEANVRSYDNPLFTGALGIYNGVLVYEYSGIAGDQGTKLRPEATVSGSHTAAVTTLTVGSNTDGDIDYTEFFPSTGTLSVVDASGNLEFITYTGLTETKNSGRAFTGCTRGAAYGSLTNDGAAAYTGVEHVTLNNRQSAQIFFGAEIACRSFVKPLTPINQTEDYGFERGLGFKTIFGQKAIENVGGTPPNYVLMYSFAGTPVVGI